MPTQDGKERPLGRNDSRLTENQRFSPSSLDGFELQNINFDSGRRGSNAKSNLDLK